MRILLCCAALFLLAACSPRAANELRIPEETVKIHQKAIVFDAHCDTAMRLVGDRKIDLAERHADGHIDLPRAKEGGLDAQIFAVWVSPEMPAPAATERARAMIDALWEQSRAHASAFEIARSGKDVRRIVKEGKLAGIIGIEGGHLIGEDLGALDDYQTRGVRVMTLTWMNTNLWADASDDTAKWGGLNDFGRSVVREMDRLHMLIDLSHASEKTVMDVLATTKNPVVVSHSCMRALTDIPRNVSDEVLRAVSKNDGVVCVNFFAGFLDKDFNEKSSGLWAEYHARAKELAAQYGGDQERAWHELEPELDGRMAEFAPVPLSRLVDHIDHAVKVAGVDHVGFGSDFDGISVTPAGLEDVSKLPGITAELERRGYSERDIRKILGGNLLRLVEKVVK